MYFAALLARTEDGWEASDTELDDVETLSDLADLAREATSGGYDDETVLVFIEQEDAWFGIVRVEGEDDPRIYVSDAAAASRSSYGEILVTDELLGREPGSSDDSAHLEELVDLDGTEDGEPATDPDDDSDDGDASVPAGPLGDIAILDDLGLPEKELLSLRTDALNTIAEALGASDVLEAVR
ncbi:tRNA adenosine deaminase-associated protein [Streptomyces cavernicola]|uniref:tRNA adenosine deaminase-associated protein n=1 Tax=Streptomyces cavernicola TaxID=3043613 RepID=A0ABT6S3I2_9ACTN|nr:hypothetical protein [Streptomyces sp. B-S-A6]MDI3402647.1 hypothetical protein [Streptomyces sp. B-S-A6]